MTTGFVYVIESPSDLDLLDGRTEGRSLCEALQLAGIPHQYSLATTKNALSESLGSRLTDARAKFKQAPILHLSMHGNEDGIGLTNKEFITWAELRQLLSPLVTEMQGGLLICMSSCSGSSGCRMAMHKDNEPPFWALVGNTKSALWSDAAVAYITFYHLFFKDFSVVECVKGMCVASGDNNFVSYLGTDIKTGWAKFIEGKNL